MAKLYHNPTTYFSTPLKPFARKTKKNTKYNHVSLCSTRDPTHIHTVINRFRAIASPPRGQPEASSTQLLPSCGSGPQREYVTFFLRATICRFFVFLVYFWCRGSQWVQLISRLLYHSSDGPSHATRALARSRTVSSSNARLIR